MRTHPTLPADLRDTELGRMVVARPGVGLSESEDVAAEAAAARHGVRLSHYDLDAVIDRVADRLGLMKTELMP